jgi:hypothetical protein
MFVVGRRWCGHSCVLIFVLCQIYEDWCLLVAKPKRWVLCRWLNWADLHCALVGMVLFTWVRYLSLLNSGHVVVAFVGGAKERSF